MLADVSDRDLLLELARRLKLKETPFDPELPCPPSNEFFVDGKTIEFGSGKGCPDTSVVFGFDGDKLVEHQIWQN